LFTRKEEVGVAWRKLKVEDWVDNVRELLLLERRRQLDEVEVHLENC
jgi:hypothetical protein